MAPSAWPSLAGLAVEAPYLVPADMDLSRINGMISARATSARDHVLALREDPGYYEEYVTFYANHGPEMLVDARGEKIHMLDSPDFWRQVIAKVVSDAYANVVLWTHLHDQTERLVKLKNRSSKKIA